MVNVIKMKNAHGYNMYYIETEDGKFRISFEGDLGLYWTFLPANEKEKDQEMHEVVITKENYFIYQLFNRLYGDIKERTELHKKDNPGVFDPYQLLRRDVIDWHSDDEPYEEASRFLIRPENENFVVTFVRGKSDSLAGSFAVCIRNSGSNHAPFNADFIKMYNSLIDYDPEFHQIHIEELLYQQKVLKKLK